MITDYAALAEWCERKAATYEAANNFEYAENLRTLAELCRRQVPTEPEPRAQETTVDGAP